MSITDYPNGSDNTNPLVLTDNSTDLQVTSGTATQSGDISESGGSFGLEKTGAGTLIYLGDNTYTGVTTISGGTLQVGSDFHAGGSLGPGAVVNNAILTFTRADDIIVANVISGTGTLIQKGWYLGSLTLTGVNTYTGGTIVDWYSNLALSGAGSISASQFINVLGTLDVSQTNSGVTIQGLNGSGTVALGSHTLTFSKSQNSVTGFDGVIRDGGIAGGTGASIVISNSHQQFGGANTYTGTTTIAAGAIAWLTGATGSFGSGAIINDGTLMYARSVATTARLMSGAGGMSQLGSGTLTVAGVQGYTGKTETYAGSTLALCGVGSIAASSGLTNVGTFDISGTTAGASLKKLNGSDATGVVALGGKTLTITDAGNYSVFRGVIRDGGIAGGTGGGLVIDSGKQVLLGTHTYTGGTILNGATLQLGITFTSGSITGNVSGSGTVAFKRSDLFGGVISGNINVVLGDPLTPNLTGTTVLTGANTYTGGTTIDTGVLQLGTGGSLPGTGALTINGGTFDLNGRTQTVGALSGTGGSIQLGSGGLTTNSNANTILASAISGSGSLTKSGAGTLTLFGANTHTGGTTISGGGTIAVSSDANLGNANGALTFNNGALKFLGVFNLSSARAITLQGGGGAVNTIDTNGFATTISQVISGSGGLVKAGANTLKLSGANAFTGGLTVTSGDLALGTSSAAGTNSIVMASAGFATLDYANGISVANNVVIQNNSAWLTVSDGSGTATQSGIISENNGPQSLVKFGYGKLVLAGHNTYTGGTVIRLGTLQVSADENFGDPFGAITFLNGHSILQFGAAFNINPSRAIIVNNTPGLIADIDTNGFDITLAQGISGPGTFGKTGTGTLTLNGVSTFAGASGVSGGVLRLGVDGALPSSNFTVSGLGTLDLNNHNQTLGTLAGSGAIALGSGTLTVNGLSTWDGVIGGTGGIVIANTFNISKANTYTGGTTVTSSGNLKIGVNNTGSIAGDITDNGIVTFNRNDATTFSGAISGTGTVVQANSGTTSLTGANSYSGGTTVSGGTLQVGNGGTTGSITGNVAVSNGSKLAFNRSDNLTYNGIVSGAGGVTKSGSGTTILGATSTYTGATAINSGTLLVNGSIAPSAAMVANGASLGGTGTIGSTTVQSGGALTPGNGIGTLQVNGNLILASGSNYIEELSSVTADQTTVNGNASIAGKLTANFAGGGFGQQNYTILHATGTLTGSFASIALTGLGAPGVTATVSYGAHDVILSVTSQDSWSADFGGDGKADMLWQKPNGTVLIWRTNRSGTVAASTSVGVIDPAAQIISGVGDYNGDGKADILLRHTDGTVTEWLMNGETIASSNNLGNMDSSWSICGTGDVGGDGKADIFWQKSDGSVVIWQMNSAGAMASSTNLGVLNPALWSLLNVADYNGDGKADVLLRNADGTVYDWLMNGAAIAGSNLLGTMDSSWSVKGTGDFGGDGKADILWQKSNGTIVMWHMNAAGTVAVTSNLGVLNPAVWSLSAVSDYNGDGKADILLRNADGTVADWVMNGATITGSHSLGTVASPVITPPPAVINDFGGDGKADILWHKADGTATMWQMNGSGTVASMADVIVVDPAVSSIVGIGDYNGDGKADILLHNADDSVTEWLMNGSAIAGTVNLPQMSQPVKGTGDFNGDGKVDILWGGANTATMWLMDAGGGIANSINLNTTGVSIAGVGDYNGDGTADILLRKLDGTVGDWLISNGQISGSNNLGQMDSSWSVIGSGDFNGDGISDILWQKSDGTVVVWQMNGANTVASKTTLGILGPAAWSLSTVADHNGDGKADILLRNASGAVYNWLMNGPAIAGSNGLGTMSSSALSAPPLVTVPVPHLTVRKDFDDEGHADILWRKSDGTVVLWRMNGAGTIGSISTLHAVDPAVSTLASLGDYNGDGFADLLLRNTDTSVQVWLGPNAGNFQVLGMGQTMDSSWSLIGSGDFGADGADDMMWQKSDGTVLVWTMGKGSGLTGGNVSGITNLGIVNPAAWSLSAVADFNGDGKSDVLLRNANGAVYNWLMNGPGIAGSNFLETMDSSWQLKGTGDFGGDGKADLLWHNSNGTVVIWQMSSTGTVASTTNLGLVNPATWSFADVADYNGDGKADILLRNSNGSVDTWLMNGASITGSSTLGSMNNLWSAISR